MLKTIISSVKRTIFFYKIFLAIVLLFIIGCGGGDKGGGNVDNDLNPSADSFKFIILSDTHVRIPGNPDYDNNYYPGNLSNLSDALALIQKDHSDADFVVTNGDNVGCLFSSNVADYGVGIDNPAERFKTMMDSLGKPYYVTLGNHDYEDGFNTTPRLEGITSDYPAEMEEIWKKVLGINSYYSFVHKGVRFIILNSVHGPDYSTACPVVSTYEKSCKGSFYDDQINWLETELQKTDMLFCLIFLHHPVITDNNLTKQWSALGVGVFGEAFQLRSSDPFYTVVQTYKDKIKGIFVGHGHMMQNDVLHSTIPVYETASIGDANGSSSNIRIVWMDPYTGTMLTK